MATPASADLSARHLCRSALLVAGQAGHHRARHLRRPAGHPADGQSPRLLAQAAAALLNATRTTFYAAKASSGAVKLAISSITRRFASSMAASAVSAPA